MQSPEVSPQHPWMRAFLLALVAFLVAAGYLWLRRWGAPLYTVLYKISFAGLATAGTFLLAYSYGIGPFARFFPRLFVSELSMRKYYGLLGYFLIVVHVVWALATFGPKRYPRLFVEGEFTTITIVSLILGVTAFALFSIVAFTSMQRIATNMSTDAWKTTQRVGYLGLLVALVHFTVLKYKGWLAIATWPSLPVDYFSFLSFVSLPPLSLLLFVFIVGVFLLRGLAIVCPGQLPGK